MSQKYLDKDAFFEGYGQMEKEAKYKMLLAGLAAAGLGGAAYAGRDQIGKGVGKALNSDMGADLTGKFLNTQSGQKVMGSLAEMEGGGKALGTPAGQDAMKKFITNPDNVGSMFTAGKNMATQGASSLWEKLKTMPQDHPYATTAAIAIPLMLAMYRMGQSGQQQPRGYYR